MLPYILKTECRVDTYSIISGIDCEAFDRIKDNEPINKVDLLTSEEKIEYYKMKCTDDETRQKLDLVKYLSSTCDNCCNKYLQEMEEDEKLANDPVIRDYTYPISKEIDEDYLVLIKSKSKIASEWLEQTIKTGKHTLPENGELDVMKMM